MANYVLPQVLIYQEFSLAPTALTAPLRACIMGPQYALFRYDDADEKATVKVTDHYDPDGDTAYAWPGRPAGGVVDESYTRVFMEDALLQYYHDAGVGLPIHAVAGYRNRVRFDGLVLKTANGYSRSAAFYDRDVAIGDVLELVASACGEPHRVQSQIIGLVADVVPAVIDAAAADVDNQATQVGSTSNAQTAGDVNNVGVSSVGGSYDGRADGQCIETYDIEVVTGSTGGDAETATLRVTALSGTEGPFEITPSAFGVATLIGGRGLEVTFENAGSSSSPGIDPDDFIVGQIWRITVRQAFTTPTPVSGGVYAGSPDTTYIVEVSQGGAIGTAEIRVSTSTGVDSSGPTSITGVGVALPIGTQGVTLAFSAAPTGFRKGDVFTVGVVAAGEGAIKTVTLATPLPAALRGICVDSSSSSSSGTPPVLDATFYIQKDLEISEERTGYAPLVNWSQADTQITIKAGIIAFDATWTNGGVLLALPVKDGAVYVQYRALVTEWTFKVGSISDVSEISATFAAAPEIDQDNPLVYGVYQALLNSSGTGVRFIGIAASSPIELSDWTDALDVLKGRDDVYGLVPLTYDRNVQNAVAAHALAMSDATVGRWRTAWLNAQAVTEKGIYTLSQAVGRSGEVVLATVTDDPDTAGTQYTLLSAAYEKFMTGGFGVRAGDIVRIQYADDGFGNSSYQEYIIDAVLNDEELRLYTGPATPINTPSKMEIWRTLSKTECAAEMATVPGLWSNRRIRVVWPDEVGIAGEVVPGYYLCCSLAGLRSASLPHRPLTHVEIIGWDDLTRTTEFFTDDQLNTMADSGWWIVTQDPNDGSVFTRHQLTSDNQDLNHREDSISSNVDSISYTFLERVKPYIGKGNISPTMVSIIEGEVLSVLDYFSNFIVQDLLGPQLLSYEIKELKQHPLLKDRILAIVQLEVPAPFNNFELHLVV